MRLARYWTMASRIIRIGTAGWSIPAAHNSEFPASGTHLERYSERMTCVEINSSFYRSHQRKTYEKWAASVPPNFRFAVKTPQHLTHLQSLKGPAPGIKQFASEVAGLGRKLGVVLVQLPPSLAFEARVADRFFAIVKDHLPAAVACEPRHASWFTPDVNTWLKTRRIARVAADPARALGADNPGGWRGMTYFRLHGSPRMYWSAYDRTFLRGIATQLKRETAPTWCILDNTAKGHALGDALTIMDRVVSGES